MNIVQEGRHRPAPTHREDQRAKLVACAEAEIAAHGLAALRARRLAESIGCAVGTIYNLVDDLDELALLVAQRTMADLNAEIDAASRIGRQGADRFVDWALAYARFAAAHRNRWRALFEHRLPPGRALPEWFAIDQRRLFVRLEDGLEALGLGLDAAARRVRARTLFSAVHGIVALGLEEKLVAMPPAALDAEIEAFLRAYLAGLRGAADQDFAIKSTASP